MKYIFTLFFGLVCVFISSSQETKTKNKEIDEIIDSLFNEDEIIDELIKSLSNFHYLYVSNSYSSSTYFSGRDIQIDQYNLKPQISYVHSKGFFASLSGIYYSGFVPNWDVTIASIGFGKYIGKKKQFKYSTSFSKYFYNNEIDNLYTNAITGGLGFRNNSKFFGTQISGTFLFGKDQSYQFTSSSYLVFNLLKSKKTSIKFRPQVNVIAGKQTIELATIRIQNDIPITDITQNDVFELINTQLNFPIEINVNSFDMEFGYNINLPSAIGRETDLKSTSFFNLSIGYLINL
jgi:hypothetical protein